MAAAQSPGAPRRPFRDVPPWLRENLEHSLPFLVGGGVCVGLAVWLHLFVVQDGGSRLSLWMLLAAIGGTLSGGGVALTVVEEPQPMPGADTGALVSVPRTEWEAWQRSRSALREPAPAPTPGPTRVPAGLPVRSPGPAPPAPAVASRPPVIDAAAVARVTEDLLRPGTSQPRPPEWGVTGPAPIRTVPASHATASAGVPATRSTARPSSAPVISKPPSTPAPVPPVWLEEPLREFESMLADIEQGTRAAPSPASLRQHPAPLDRCVGCGTSVNVYSEQACIVCDRPLCDRCLEQSVIDGRPATCAACHAKVPP